MVVFVCEDSPEGIFTGVYDAWNSRLGHENVRLEVQGEYNYSLFSEYREVAVDRLKAQKVVRSVRRSLSELAYSWIYRTALSEREDRAEAVYRFLVCGFSAGAAGRRITENYRYRRCRQSFRSTVRLPMKRICRQNFCGLQNIPIMYYFLRLVRKTG